MQELELNRRTFIGGAAALAAACALPARAAEKPNSNFGGVQIGLITYSFRSLSSDPIDLLKYIVESGVSSIELMGPSAEEYAKGDIARFKTLGKMYKDAGVGIHIIKFPDIGNNDMPDEKVEYYFEAAKAIGAKGITRELSEDAAKRLGPIADKHKIMIGFHNHTQIRPDSYDGDILSYGKYLGINFDIGHYVAGTNESPIPFIDKFADRITNLHIKDRKVNNGANMPWGEGDTPLALTLLHMKKMGYKFPADIELEYKVPEDSDALKEVKKCVDFCKQVLA